MADVEWIKLSTDIFGNRKIKQIEAMPDGDSLIIIWIKLIVLAGEINDGGCIYFTPEIPYTDQLLATQFNRPLATIQLALQTFRSFRMIDIEDDVIHITNWERYQNVERLDQIREQTRARVAKHREKKRLEFGSMTCQYCGESATGYDHIIPLARGGTDTDDNKVPCCIKCNRIKNDKPLVDFLNNNREIINDDIVRTNEKLSRYVTLCNVTDRYIVTQCNATDIDKNKNRTQNKNTTKESKPKKSVFRAPTVEEVAAYCRERKNHVDAEHFVAHYEANGWMVGRNHMKDWKAAVRTWERNGYDKPKKGPNGVELTDDYNGDLDDIF